MTTITHSHEYNLMRDLAIIMLSAVLALIVAKIGIIKDLTQVSHSFKFLGSFVAGLFFTSIFTVPLSTVILVEIAKTNGLWAVAFFGACGAMIGDLILFRFIKHHVVDDLKYLVDLAHHDRLRHILHLKLFRYLTPLLGAIIIASPLPDELGIMMMGLSQTQTSFFVPVSFVFNFLGIIFVNMIAKSI